MMMMMMMMMMMNDDDNFTNPFSSNIMKEVKIYTLQKLKRKTCLLINIFKDKITWKNCENSKLLLCLSKICLV